MEASTQQTGLELLMGSWPGTGLEGWRGAEQGPVAGGS